jgi:FlaA1/EpsC-like NDP-sugar epimerase
VILVTGGGGSIGSELCRQIAKFNPKKLLILDIYENNVYDVQMELNYKYPDMEKEVIIASIRDEKRLRGIFEKYKPDVVFHAAAHKHVPLMEANPAEAIKNNIIGTYNVLKCSHDFKVEKFVQISTDKAVNPTNIMGATKRFCEIMVQAFDRMSYTEYVAVRFGNVLGSNGSVIPLFKKQIAHGGPVTVTHPEINRFFMTIPEAAQLVIQAGAIAAGGEIFVLDMGEPVKIVDLAKDLITLSGYKPDVDIKIEYTGLRPGEKLYEELLMDEIALTSTEHNKIFVEKPNEIDIKFVEKSIEEFKNVTNMSKEEILNLVEKKVPTYVRKKS